jgi:hypothetical protein
LSVRRASLHGAGSRCWLRIEEAEQGGLPGGTTPHRLAAFHSSVTIWPSAAWTETVLTCEDTEQPALASARPKVRAAIRIDENVMPDPLMGRLHPIRPCGVFAASVASPKSSTSRSRNDVRSISIRCPEHPMILETLICLFLVALPLSLTGWVMGQY